MRILVLDGTRFIGLHVVEAALAAGHEVDVFSRGTSPVPPGVGHVAGDRDGDLTVLREHEASETALLQACDGR